MSFSTNQENNLSYSGNFHKTNLDKQIRCSFKKENVNYTKTPSETCECFEIQKLKFRPTLSSYLAEILLELIIEV